MSDEEYFRSCVAKERHLAQLLGHHNIEEFYENAGVLWDNAQALPKWTRDWKACGPLLAQYDIPLSYHRGSCTDAAQSEDDAACDTVRAGAVTVHYADHPNRDRAIMFAIVKAVIFILEHAKAHHLHPHPAQQATP